MKRGSYFYLVYLKLPSGSQGTLYKHTEVACKALEASLGPTYHTAKLVLA